MTASKTSDRIKLALIPVLLLVLGGVLYWPSDDAAVPDVPTLVVPLDTQRPTQPATNSPTAKSAKVRWKEYSLEAVAAFSPFDPLTPRANEHATVKDVASQEDQTPSGETTSPKVAAKVFKTGPLQAVYHDGRTTVALINSRLVRPGDWLEEGVRVVDVTTEGLVVEVE